MVNLSVAGAGATVPIDLFRWHWQAEQELESSGIAWTHLRPTDLSRHMVKAVLPTVQEQGLMFSTAEEGRVALVGITRFLEGRWNARSSPTYG